MSIEKEKLVVIYDRFATEPLSDNKLTKRTNKLVKLAKQHGYTPVKTYTDVASGTINPFKRHQFSKLVSDLPTTKPTAVIISDHTRITRSFSDLFTTILWLQVKGVELITMIDYKGVTK